MSPDSSQRGSVKVVPRGRLGRLLGLKPKVYRCRDEYGVWRRDHEGPMWAAGFARGERLPCIHCYRRVVENNMRPSR